MKLVKTIPILIFLTALFQLNSAVSQSPVDTYKSLASRYKDKELEIKTDSLLDLCGRKGDLVSKAEIAHKHALVYVRGINKNFVKALKYGNIEISALENEDVTDTSFRSVIKPEIIEKGYVRDSMLVRALYNVGRFYTDNTELENAVEIFEKIIEINCTPSRTAQAYTEIARCRNNLGDFFNAVDYYQKGIDLLEAQKEYVLMANHSINIATAYRNINTPESLAKGQQALETADSLNKIYPLDAQNYRAMINDLANQYISESTYDFEKARRYYALSLEKGFINNDTLTVAMALNNLGNLYNLEKNDSALYYIEEAFSYVKQTETEARLFDNKSDYYLLKNEPDKALIESHKALESILTSGFELSGVPDALTLSESDFKSLTIFFLKKKAEVLIRLFHKTGQKDFLSQTIQNVKAADRLIDIIQSGSYENETKLLWRKEASEVYIKGVYAAQRSDQPTELFYFTEKNKALLLSEEIAKNTTYASLPKNISDRATMLKKTILRWENTQLVTADDQDALFEAKQYYEDYIDSIKQVFPAYFKDKLSINPISLTQWQQSLKPETTFVSYIWNKLNDKTEALIGLVVTHDKSVSFTITSTDSLKALLAEYQQLVSRPLQTKTDQAQLFKVNAALFSQLLPDSEVREMAKDKRLIIVPDGPLQGIPFEALVTDNEEFLIQHTDVSYLYSVSFLSHNERVKRRASRRFLAYAPVNFGNTGLAPLNRTLNELEAIGEQIDGRLRIKAEASKEDFLSRSKEYRIIHLATHANANTNPWIAFSDDRVELHELYTYRNNADLVTLSACNTLLGEVASGEGVLSLSRGFFYSGAKSVVASLWNIDDQSTSTIMADFYANLKAGQRKSQALNNAKRNYLKTHSLSEQSPYYWSSFVLIGDDEPIDFSNNYYPYLIAILLVSLSIFIYMKKKPKV